MVNRDRFLVRAYGQDSVEIEHQDWANKAFRHTVEWGWRNVSEIIVPTAMLPELIAKLQHIADAQ